MSGSWCSGPNCHKTCPLFGVKVTCHSGSNWSTLLLTGEPRLSSRKKKWFVGCRKHILSQGDQGPPIDLLTD